MSINSINLKILYAHENFEAFFSLTSEKYIKNNGIHCNISKIQNPYFNIISTTNIKDTNHLDEQIKSIINIYESTVTSFCWWVGSLTRPIDLSEQLLLNKFEKQASYAVMFCELDKLNTDITIPSNMLVEQVTQTNLLRDWVNIFKSVFEFNDEIANTIFTIYNSKLNNNCLKHFVVYHAKKPIACATVFIKNSIAGLYNLGVLPDFRRQGIGTLLQKMRMNFAIEQGCQGVILQAAKSSESIAEKLMFKKIDELIPFVYSYKHP